MDRRGLSRRKLLIGAGAATAGFGVIALSPGRARAEAGWDREADVVVVGSGAGASSAAIAAHDAGDAVVMLDKAPVPGGTSARSAGVLWIPDNFALRAKGIRDEKADCLRYMARFAYPERYDPSSPDLGCGPLAYSLLEAFYDNASPTIERLRAGGVLRLAEWRGFVEDVDAIDYLDHVPENKVPTGRALGPLREDGKMGLGADLMAQFRASIEQRGIPVLLEHRVMRLIKDGERVVGVEAEAGGKGVRIGARKGVVFATGGYAHDPELLATHQRNRFWGACAGPWATGDFIRIAGAAGARMGNLTGAWRTQVVFEEALKGGGRIGLGVFFPPGDSMLQVNRHGRRVVNEHRNYNDRTNAHGYYDPANADYPNQLLFMVYDRRTAEAFAGNFPLPADAAPAPYVIEGATLAALAAAIGRRLEEVKGATGGFLPSPDFARNLEASVARFNGFARAGKDEDFGRGAAAYDREWHRVFSPMAAGSPHAASRAPNRTMHPLSAEGPYYAIILAAGALDTNGGPQVDAGARVLGAEGQPIPGLYGAGNCIASPSRFAYFGAGHTLAMAVTFGAIAAASAHRDARAEAA